MDFEILWRIFYIWRGWTRSRSPRGRNLNFRSAFLKHLHVSVLKHSSGLGSITPWSASARRCYHTNSRQNPAYVALFREICLIPYMFNYFHYLQNSSGLGNSTLWSASSRRCGHTKFHQNPAYVALFREKSLIPYIFFIFITYRTVQASGIARHDPPRHVDVIIPSFIKVRLM